MRICIDCLYDDGNGACRCRDMTEDIMMHELTYDYCPYWVRKHVYVITSERADQHEDEYKNELYTSAEYELGQAIIRDGLTWFVEDILM